MKSERADLSPERDDFRPEKVNLRSERVDLRPRVAWGGDGKRRNKITLCGIIGHRPLWGRCPKMNLPVIFVFAIFAATTFGMF